MGKELREFNSYQLSVISYQLSVKYASETPHQLMVGVGGGNFDFSDFTVAISNFINKK
jgi:hypothetical protein